MNSTRTSSKFPSPFSTAPGAKVLQRAGSQGFSLIEVLVTALLIGTGLLGMATLQARAVVYTSDAAQHFTATLLAADLLELVRASPLIWARHLQDGTSKAPEASARCTSTPSLPAAQMACWRAEVATLLPGSDELPATATYACRSPASGVCAAEGSIIEIQVAWIGSQGHCPATDGHCHVRLRSEP